MGSEDHHRDTTDWQRKRLLFVSRLHVLRIGTKKGARRRGRAEEIVVAEVWHTEPKCCRYWDLCRAEIGAKAVKE